VLKAREMLVRKRRTEAAAYDRLDDLQRRIDAIDCACPSGTSEVPIADTKSAKLKPEEMETLLGVLSE
jgi:hypothetical protein